MFRQAAGVLFAKGYRRLRLPMVVSNLTWMNPLGASRVLGAVGGGGVLRNSSGDILVLAVKVTLDFLVRTEWRNLCPLITESDSVVAVNWCWFPLALGNFGRRSTKSIAASSTVNRCTLSTCSET